MLRDYISDVSKLTEYFVHQKLAGVRTVAEFSNYNNRIMPNDITNLIRKYRRNNKFKGDVDENVECLSGYLLEEVCFTLLNELNKEKNSKVLLLLHSGISMQ